MTFILSPQEDRIRKNGGKIIFGFQDGKSRVQKIYDSFSEGKSYVDV